MSRDRIILFVVGVFALATVIFGYSGLYRKITRDPYYDLKQECYYIIDHAQLWFIRPEKYGGGGRSFIGLDFHKAGLFDRPNSITWNGEHGHYTITDLRGDSFGLLARAPDGVEFEVLNIRFDTRPEVKRRF